MHAMTVDPWIVDLFATIDRMDAAGFAKAFAEDATFRFGNSNPAMGRQDLEQAVAGFFSMIGGLTHDIKGVWTGHGEDRGVTSVESDVTYVRKDGGVVGPLPAMTTIRLQGDEIRDYRIFMDISPVFAA